MSLFLFFYPSKQSLFDNPTTGTFHALSELVDFLGQGRRNMSRQNASLNSSRFRCSFHHFYYI